MRRAGEDRPHDQESAKKNLTCCRHFIKECPGDEHASMKDFRIEGFDLYLKHGYF